jgi:hypothetical protein
MVRNCLVGATIEDGNERLVDQNSASWNQIVVLLNGIDALRRVV